VEGRAYNEYLDRCQPPPMVSFEYNVNGGFFQQLEKINFGICICGHFGNFVHVKTT